MTAECAFVGSLSCGGGIEEERFVKDLVGEDLGGCLRIMWVGEGEEFVGWVGCVVVVGLMDGCGWARGVC